MADSTSSRGSRPVDGIPSFDLAHQLDGLRSRIHAFTPDAWPGRSTDEAILSQAIQTICKLRQENATLVQRLLSQEKKGR